MCSTTPLTVLDMRRNSFPSLDVRTSENNGQTNTKSQSQQTLPDVDSQTRSAPDTDSRQIEQTKTKYELLTIQTISNRNDTTQSKQTQIKTTKLQLVWPLHKCKQVNTKEVESMMMEKAGGEAMSLLTMTLSWALKGHYEEAQQFTNKTNTVSTCTGSTGF